MNPSTASDLQLIAWIKSGKTHFFKYIVERHQQKGMAVAVSVTQDRDLAEDVLQDAFVSAYKNLSHFQPSSPFGAWLYRIVFNTSLNAVKKRKRDFFSLEDEVADHATDASVASALEDSEQKQRILNLLESMPPSEALVLRFFYLMDMSILEIESVTDLSQANIKTLLHRARKRFRSQWSQDEGGIS